jgi:hypothetical protein
VLGARTLLRRSSSGFLIPQSAVLDLLGDDLPADTGAAGAGPAGSAQQTQDLLADIFGSAPSAAPAVGAPPASSASAHADIMSLFGGGSAAAPTPAAGPSASSSLSGLDSLFAPSSSSSSSSNSSASAQLQQASRPAPPAASAPPPAPSPAAASGPTAYTAYDRHGLKVTLTPRPSPSQPGVYQILAKFTATTGVPCTGVNFQAAVPRVRVSSCARQLRAAGPATSKRRGGRHADLTVRSPRWLPIDATAADAGHVQCRHPPGHTRDAADACDGPCRRAFRLTPPLLQSCRSLN